METNKEYVKRKLDTGLFNLTVMAKAIGINRHTLINIGKGRNAQHATFELVASFFRKIGE